MGNTICRRRQFVYTICISVDDFFTPERNVEKHVLDLGIGDGEEQKANIMCRIQRDVTLVLLVPPCPQPSVCLPALPWTRGLI